MCINENLNTLRHICKPKKYLLNHLQLFKKKKKILDTQKENLKQLKYKSINYKTFNNPSPCLEVILQTRFLCVNFI